MDSIIMNKVHCFLISSIFASFVSGNVIANEIENIDTLTAEAKTIVKRFGGTLKPKLKQAIKSGGLVHAVDVCATQAPQIAKALSSETSWEVKRVSLKARSTQAQPDKFEQNILKQFDEASQINSRKLDYAKIVDGEFRYLKAQKVEGVCLNCHGENISSEVKAVIKQHYPNDMATGYALGNVRGAFSLTKQL